MTDDVRALLTGDAKHIVERHLPAGRRKPVSYLPIETIETVLGLTIQGYVSLIENSGNKAVVLGTGDCCINSGAVYAYSCKELNDILGRNHTVLADHQWPTTSADFIARMAAEWLEWDNPVMPVIRQAFGDE
jgi:hypothetical protein